MDTMTYIPATRDLEFVLFEALPTSSVLGHGRFAEVKEEDVRLILEAASTFASEELVRGNAEGDRVAARWDNGKVFVPSCFEGLWEKVKEQGWLTVRAPVDHGGQGLPNFVGSIVDELFIGANPAFAIHMGLNTSAVSLLIEHASQDLKDKYIPSLLSGAWQGTMCLTEAGAGSDVGASSTRAVPQGDGSYKIKGTKVFISAGDHQLTENHVHLVLARLPDAPAGSKGLSLFLVPKHRVNEDGSIGAYNDVYCSKIEHKMGLHGSPTCVLNFGDNDGCIGWLVGHENQGMRCMFTMMNEERIVVGQQGQALASAMYFQALRYAKERIQGSDIAAGKTITDEKVAIIAHPDVRRLLMTVKALAEGGRALLFFTSLNLDQSRVETDPRRKALHEGIVALMTPVCKAWGSDTGMEAASAALQVYGGSGFIADFPAEQYFRDARIASIYEGTNGIQSLDLLFRKVLGGDGKLVSAFAEEVGRSLAATAAHPVLAREAAALKDALGDLVLTTRRLGELARGDMRHAALGASPYLVAFGNVVVAWLLLQQGVVAHARLDAMGLPTDPAARQAALENSSDGRFYHDKLQTVRFFFSQVLSQNKWKTAQILGGDTSALDAIL